MPVKPIDQYATSITGDEALKFELPPTPAAPTEDPNLLTMYVPSERTTLELGAGKTPGIRMATDHHAHVTARAPLTTISLGAPGGEGISDPALGLHVTTEGEKLEHVVGRVRVMHDDTQEVTVAKGRSHTVTTGGDSLHVADGDRTVSVDTGNHTTNVKLLTKLETDNYEAHARYDVHVAGDRKIELKQGSTTATFEGGNVELDAAGHVRIHHKGTTILIEESGNVIIAAEPKIDIICQGAEVSMSAGKVAIHAPSEIVLAVGKSGLKISESGVEISGPSVKSTALTGVNEISGLLVKLN